MINKVYQTGAGAIAYVFEPNTGFQLEEIVLKLSAAGGAAENFSVDEIDNNGAEYGANIVSQDMNTVTTLKFQPDRPFEYQTGDKLDFTYTNTNSRTWGLTIKFKPING